MVCKQMERASRRPWKLHVVASYLVGAVLLLHLASAAWSAHKLVGSQRQQPAAATPAGRQAQPHLSLLLMPAPDR